jgi:hypothetical protein
MWIAARMEEGPALPYYSKTKEEIGDQSHISVVDYAKENKHGVLQN